MEAPKGKFQKRLRWALIALGVACLLYVGYRIKVSHDQDAAITAAQSEEHFIEGETSFYDLGEAGHTLLTPTILPPTTANGRVRNETWIRFPDGTTLKTIPSKEGKPPSVEMPTGTRIERLTWLRESSEDGQWTLADIRGIVFAQDSLRSFHVHRPKSTDVHADLFGFEWLESSQEDADSALAHFRTMMDTGMGFALEEPRFFKGRMIDYFANMHACAGCHAPNNPALTYQEGRKPTQRTDHSGLYTLLAVLTDEMPTRIIEKVAPHDPNTANPYISVMCGKDPAEKKEERGRMGRGTSTFFSCPENDEGRKWVPLARFDMRTALANNDSHAAEVCRSRAFLFNHLDTNGKEAFKDAFEICGIKTP